MDGRRFFWVENDLPSVSGFFAGDSAPVVEAKEDDVYGYFTDGRIRLLYARGNKVELMDDVPSKVVSITMGVYYCFYHTPPRVYTAKRWYRLPAVEEYIEKGKAG